MTQVEVTVLPNNNDGIIEVIKYNEQETKDLIVRMAFGLLIAISAFIALIYLIGWIIVFSAWLVDTSTPHVRELLNAISNI